MAFVTVEDLYGQCEIIVFENCYQNCAGILTNESIVAIEGRLSICHMDKKGHSELKAGNLF